VSDDAADLMAWTEADAAKNSAGCHAVAIAALRERLEASRVVIGDCTLYCEDCAFILPTLTRVDAVVSDPPYGIGAHAGVGQNAKKFENERDWDKYPAPDRLMTKILLRGKYHIIWGGISIGCLRNQCGWYGTSKQAATLVIANWRGRISADRYVASAICGMVEAAKTMSLVVIIPRKSLSA
jgi:tRNA G10  N-methylase Trm11